MLYIGFSDYSYKIHARIFCKKLKHCAPVVIDKDTAIIYQFVRINKIEKIRIKKRDFHILEKHGWIFIKWRKNTKAQTNTRYNCFTCVQFTKKMCGIKNIKIQTPLALFNYIRQK